MTALLTAPSSSALAYPVVAYAAYEATTAQLTAFRKQPGPNAPARATAAALRPVDEQSVVALAAVLQALHDHGLPLAELQNWGILAGPQHLGRGALANIVRKFAVDGPWTFSPMHIPQRSLHSVSGFLSYLLGIHGPNLGIGGGATAAAETLLTALTWLATEPLPGVLVALTGFDPEILDLTNGSGMAEHAVCKAVVLALGRAPQPGTRLWLEYAPASSHGTESPSLAQLSAALGNGNGAPRKQWQLPMGGCLGVHTRAA